MRTIRSAIVAMILTLAVAVPALAIAINVSPNLQTGPYGQSISWTSSWNTGQGGPYVATLRPDDGSTTKTKTVSGLSTSFSHRYYECRDMTVNPVGQVYDQSDFRDSETVTVNVRGGALC